jgi:hypothetical protein
MSKLLTLEDGIMLTRFARRTIEGHILHNEKVPFPKSPSEALTEHRGVFVTLKKQHQRNKQKWELRGCIGHLQPEPDSHHQSISLLEATRQAALSSALEDPRFPPVRPDELGSILVETSVLTVPQEMLTADRTKVSDQIAIGQDGLIIQGKGWHRGLLLPQVAPEQGWNAEDFLQGCCQKAGLPPSCYLDSSVTILKFQAQIFAESAPNGEIKAREF